MAHLYANENFPAQVVKHLRELGHDVLTVFEAGNAEQQIPDAQVLSFASKNSRAVLTINRRDFIREHHLQSDHAGIIVCTQDKDIQGQALRIHEAILNADSLYGKLIRVIRPSR